MLRQLCKCALIRLQSPAAITLQFNWASVLFYSFFVAYGFFGAFTPEWTFVRTHWLGFIGLSGIMLSLFALLGLVAWKAPEAYRDSMVIRYNDILIYLSFWVIFLPYSFEQLHFSLFCDEISYSTASQQLSAFLALALADKTTRFDDLPFQDLVQTISLGFVVAGLIISIGMSRLAWKWKLPLWILLLGLCRIGYSFFLDGNQSPYPPLNLIPLFGFSTLFGVTDVAFKYAFFATYLLFILILFRLLNRQFSFLIAYLTALAIGTIPLLWHLGGIVEPSLWTSICFTLVLLELVTTEKPKLFRLMSFIAIATLMRQPTFIAVIPVLAIFLVEAYKTDDRHHFLSKLFLLLLPTLLFIPFLGKSLVYGTPSTTTLHEGSSAIANILQALHSEVIWASTLNSVPILWILCLPCAFLPFSRQFLLQNSAFLLFFGVAVAMYYAIHPSFWGLAKYQAEYVLPFAIVGLVLVLQKCKVYRYTRPLLLFLLPLLMITNTADFTSLPQGNKPVDTLAESLWADSKKFASGYRVLAALPYPYREAYALIKERRLSENSYSIGTSYGWFPEVMNGYTTKAIRAAKDIKQHQDKLNTDWTYGDVNFVEQDPRIKAVMIGSLFHDKIKLLDQFKANNWHELAEFQNKRYGSSVIILEKNAD